MSYFSGRDILWTIWLHDTWLGSIDLTRIEPGVMQGIRQRILWIDLKKSGDSQKWIDSETSWIPNYSDMQMHTGTMFKGGL